MIEAWCRDLPRDEAYAIMRENRVPVAPIRPLPDVRADPHMHERGMLRWANHPEMGEIVLPSAPIRLSDYATEDVTFFPGVGADLSPARLGAGTALRVLDNASIAPRSFTKELRELAEEAEIPLQVIFCGGGTDARSFQPEGARVMSLGIPLRYTHSMVETVHADDVDATIRMVEAIIGRYAT